MTEREPKSDKMTDLELDLRLYTQALLLWWGSLAPWKRAAWIAWFILIIVGAVVLGYMYEASKVVETHCYSFGVEVPCYPIGGGS